MSIQAVQEYVDLHFSDCIEMITDICQNENGQGNLNSDERIFNYDKISLRILGNKHACSADGLRFCRKHVEFIEFKTGFERRITRENWNPNLAICPTYKIECQDYRKVFFEKSEKETKELFSSIRDKAIESYITWEKHILQNISKDHVAIHFIAVVDCPPEDRIEDIQGELSKKTPKNNSVVGIKHSLSRLQGRRDSEHHPYFYDCIHVYSFTEYQGILDSSRE